MSQNIIPIFLGMNKESVSLLMEFYSPYIKNYCKRNNLSKLWEFLLDLDRFQEIVTENGRGKIAALPEILPTFIMIENMAIEHIVKQIDFTAPLSSAILKNLNESPWEKVQTKGKIILASFLERLGFEDINFEVNKICGRVDVYATHPAKNTRIVGECGPCRFSKILETLKRDNAELWHLSKNNKTLNIYRRSYNWDLFYKIFQAYKKKSNEKFLLEIENW